MTDFEPLVSTGPIPSMLTSVAFVVCHVSVVDWPLSIVFGFADREAVGAAGAGGGGGGGGATFFLQAPTKRMMLSMNTNVINRLIECFTSFIKFYACATAGATSHALQAPLLNRFPYFQLQLGCELLPLNVNCFTFVPSASMEKI